MRYAILADIHANLTAFQAILTHAAQVGGFDAVWCLGDVVGYGPDPHECLELLRRHRHLCVAGNHDLAAVGKIDTSDFNRDAAQANRWTAGQLTREDVEYLSRLPLTFREHDVTLVHGSPRQPIWEYILSPRDALDNFPLFDTPYCLVGHSHAPVVFERLGDNRCVAHLLADGERIPLGAERLIINPGGVGQPRDGDPRAAYAIYDADSRGVYHYRIEYDIQGTQQRMKKQGLAPRLVARLAEGW